MTLTQSNVLRRIQTHGQLPTLPEVLTRILDVLDDEASSAEDITTVLASDPVITARILRLANSAFYGARFQIDTIQRAVVTVGFEAVKQLALATAVFDSLQQVSQPCFEREDFWLHSLGSAKAAQLLAFSTDHISMPEACFTAGLLHGLGKIVLSINLQGEYDEVIQQAALDRVSLRAMEQRIFQTDYAETGGWLMQQWGFPAVIVASVRNQHEPLGYRGPYQREVMIVSVAGDMARAAGFGRAGEPLDGALSGERIEMLGLEAGEIAGIVDTLSIMLDDARTLLGLFQQA